MTTKVSVHVEYCESCGYKPKYEELKQYLEDESPADCDLEVTGAPGANYTFEISINTQLIFSKVKLGGWPYPEQVLKQVEEAASGNEPEELSTAMAPSCILM